jgi:hypothetical protein
MSSGRVRPNKGRNLTMAQIHSSWLAGMANRADVRMAHQLVTVQLPDHISLNALKGDNAGEMGRTLVSLGEQVLVLNGDRATDQDALAVRLFAEQEELGPLLLPTLRRLVAYVDSVRANPLDDQLVAELREIGAEL